MNALHFHVKQQFGRGVFFLIKRKKHGQAVADSGVIENLNRKA